MKAAPRPGRPRRDLHREISECMLADQSALRRRLRALSHPGPDRRAPRADWQELLNAITRSKSRRERRRANLPRPAYPESLPVVEKRREIARAILRHQVVVICGETGSGKTTQIPKICLEVGRGVSGMIGHTQPRRIAARAIAARIAQELDSTLGHAVGYQVRFSDRFSLDTYIKVMTDGILLAETQTDRHLDQYDTIIIDEAHERSLNIDFLLGYLRQLLDRRRDLKLIVTSATIDPERFSRFFDEAPIVEVSGRMYPVDVRYRPLQADDSDEADVRQLDGIVAAVDEVMREGEGDVLVFLSGEREIRETAEALRRHRLRGTEILPLYARLSFQEQARVFQPHPGRRIVLATNVAETSLTVPGIRYVIDPGFARISRYSHRTRVQRLPIEKISQASANQRKGRCGRISAGICVRLYSEEDAAARALYTPPEILRTNLAGAILRMKALRLGDVHEFPFLERPDPRMVRDGYDTLRELQAIDVHDELTEIGRELARLPVDPRIGRMILEAREEGCLDEVLVIAAALSVQDPRERPMDVTEAADEAHAQFRVADSDFLAYLKLWEFYSEQAGQLSASKLRRLCRTNYLSFIRMREWQDIHQQLRSLVSEAGLRASKPPDSRPGAKTEAGEKPKTSDAKRYASIHRSLLSGLLSSCGTKSETVEYLGARGVKFYLHPSSGLFSIKPPWVMSAELVETTKLYARTVARILPEWVEQIGAHVAVRTYSDPRWDQRSGRVVADERVTVFDLPVVEKRPVHYGPVDPMTAREIFIQRALAGEEYDSDAPFLWHNRRLVDEIELLEAKSRRRDVLVDERSRFDFYDARIPASIYESRAFEAWRKQAERQKPRLLFMSRSDLMLHDARGITQEQFPDFMNAQGLELPLEYRHEPGRPGDGVTVTIPLHAIEEVPGERFDWLVPGLLLEKITALIRTLPKHLRTRFIPAADYARGAYDAIRSSPLSLPEALADYLTRQGFDKVEPADFDLESLTPHLRMQFRVVDEGGREVAAGRDLAEIRRRLGVRRLTPMEILSESPYNRDGIARWDFGDMAESVEVDRHGMRIRGWPALVDCGTSVSLRLFDTPETARIANCGGVRRLYALHLSDQLRHVLASLPDLKQMCENYKPAGTAAELKTDLADAIVQDAIPADLDVRAQGDFERNAEAARGRLLDAGRNLAALVARVLDAYAAVAVRVAEPHPGTWAPAIEDIKEQLSNLVHGGFISETQREWLAHFPRYLQGVLIRLSKLSNAGVAADSERAAVIAPLWRSYMERWDTHRQRALSDPELDRYRWLLEEMRISLFAQELRTALPVSLKRLEAQWLKVKE
ncbi:MAG: ATP-dependent RNA helicase HrpA [Acidobacteriota bacterium]